jgi:hypothetical protein
MLLPPCPGTQLSRKVSSMVAINHGRLFGRTESYTDTRDRISAMVTGRDQKRAHIKAAASSSTRLNAGDTPYCFTSSTRRSRRGCLSRKVAACAGTTQQEMLS